MASCEFLVTKILGITGSCSGVGMEGLSDHILLLESWFEDSVLIKFYSLGWNGMPGEYVPTSRMLGLLVSVTSLMV